MPVVPKHFGWKVIATYISAIILAPLSTALLKHVLNDATLINNLSSLITGITVIGLSIYWLKMHMLTKFQHVGFIATMVILMALVNLLDFSQYHGTHQAGTLGNIIVSGISISVLEESLFRGPLLWWLKFKFRTFQHATWWVAIITSIVFGLFHLNNALVTGDLNQAIIQAVYTGFLGFGAAALVLKTDNILVSIVMHALYDIIGLYMSPSGVSVVGTTLGSSVAVVLQILTHLICGVILLRSISGNRVN